MAVEKKLRLAASVVVVTTGPGCFANTITNPPLPETTEGESFEGSGESEETVGDESEGTASSTGGDGDGDAAGDGDAGGDGDGDGDAGGDGDAAGDGDAGGDGDGDGCSNIVPEALTDSPYFDPYGETMCADMEGWWPDQSFYITDLAGYAAYQALWTPTQGCIDAGTVDPWPSIDFRNYDLLILGSSPGSGCELQLNLGDIEDCEGERTVSASVYWCGPCEAVLAGLKAYRVPKASGAAVIDLVESDGGVDCE